MKYELQVMKDDEALIFCETVLENGSTVESALSDLKMIDTLLHMKRIHFIVHSEIKKTKRGHLRKGTLLSDSFNEIIEARSNNQL